MNLFLSVVIPAYNEEKNLKRGVLEEIFNFLKTKNFSWEVIVSDDGSTDESGKIIQSIIKGLHGFRYFKNPHGGKPSALWHGIKTSRGKYILFTDVDQSTPISELNKFLPYLESEFDVIIGSRGLARKNFPFYRRFGSIIFAGVRKALLLRDINDTQCGFKLFKKEIIEEVFPKLEFFRIRRRAKGWKVTSYDVELLHIIKKMGYRIKEVLVEWNDRDISTSKGGGLSKYIRESREMLVEILRVKMNDLSGKYNI